MRMNTFKFSIGLALVMLLAGCPWFTEGEQYETEVGKLRINIGTGTEARAATLEPPVVMAIGSYDITISGGAGETQSQDLPSSQTTTTFSNLEAGEWTVTVNAYNTEEPAVIIAVDTATAPIVAGQTTTVDLTVVPVSGQGTLDLEVSWPDGLLADPDIAATIAPLDGDGTDISALFTVDLDGDPDAASYSGSWDDGYYTLNLAVTDGGTTVWADAYAVRIIAAAVTAETIALAESDINGTRLTLTIDSDLQNPSTVVFSEEPTSVPVDIDTTITASLDPEVVVDSYQWYLNGQLQDVATTDSITLGPGGSNLIDGTSYELSLIVRHGTVLSSGGFSFVAEATP